MHPDEVSLLSFQHSAEMQATAQKPERRRGVAEARNCQMTSPGGAGPLKPAVIFVTDHGDGVVLDQRLGQMFDVARPTGVPRR